MSYVYGDVIERMTRKATRKASRKV